jgi:hypothetical protein
MLQMRVVLLPVAVAVVAITVLLGVDVQLSSLHPYAPPAPLLCSEDLAYEPHLSLVEFSLKYKVRSCDFSCCALHHLLSGPPTRRLRPRNPCPAAACDAVRAAAAGPRLRDGHAFKFQQLQLSEAADVAALVHGAVYAPAVAHCSGE